MVCLDEAAPHQMARQAHHQNHQLGLAEPLVVVGKDSGGLTSVEPVAPLVLEVAIPGLVAVVELLVADPLLLLGAVEQMVVCP